MHYKVCYITKGYTQKYSIDYEKMTAPTAQMESFWVILHITASHGWDIQQINVKTAFLHGILPEEEMSTLSSQKALRKRVKAIG